MIITYKKGAKEYLSQHFDSSQFDCSCRVCNSTVIDTSIVNQLEILRSFLNTPVYIDSGYRCPNKQDELRKAGYETSAGISQHELGKAVDIRTNRHTGLQLAAAAEKAGFKAIGIAGGWIHVDLRNDKRRRWSYAKR